MSDEAGSEREMIEAESTNEDGRRTDDVDIPEEAFISPDEPLVRDKFRDALISPDEPLERADDDGGVVVGMDGSSEHESVRFSGVHLEPEQMAAVLEDVAAGLREHGINGLGPTPGTPHFESVLKAYIAGYYSTDY